MRKRLAVLLSALLLLVMVMPASAARNISDPIDIEDSHFDITFEGSSYDGTNTTFTYSIVQTIAGGNQYPGLSHFTLALCTPLTVVGGSQSDLDVPFKSALGYDPTTGVTGFKWDNGMSGMGPTTFTVTFAGNVDSEPVDFAIKAGQQVITGTITGPKCNGTPGLRTQIVAFKFYDTNGNGIWDEGEDGIEGWHINLNDGDWMATNENGEITFSNLNDGWIYTVTERIGGGTWVATTATSGELTPVGAGGARIEFGNRCMASSDNGTIGFWSNRNGQNLIGPADLDYLNSLPLFNKPNGNGLTKNNMPNWLRGASATNMAYMLSAQLVAAELNVMKGKTDGSVLIVVDYEVIMSVDELLADAQAALSSNADRATMTYLKDLLDALNNNTLELVHPAGACTPSWAD